MEENKEIRSFSGEASPTLTDGRTIEGYAVVFNQRSEVMLDWSPEHGVRKFVEIISPNAITEDLIQRSDVKAVIEHNRERLLARSNKGIGTLALTIDERGVKYRFDSPKTNDGDYAIEMVSRGDIQGSSFKFSNKRETDTWTKEGGVWVRTINNISGIYDITITSDPAYSQTDVSVRMLSDMDSEINKKTDYKKDLSEFRKLI